MNHPTAGTDDPTGAGAEAETGAGAGAGADGGDAAAETGRRLREVFAEAAYDIAPPPLPLEAIRRDGRRRLLRRRAAVLSTGCGLLLLPLLVLAFRPDGPAESVRPMAPPASAPVATRSSPAPSEPPPSGPPAGNVRVLAPGERVTAEDGSEFWLTREGKHWVTPEPEPGVTPMEEFRSVVDGNLDTSEPGVSLQGSGTAGGGYLVSGLFYGVRTAAARVEIRAYDGTAINGTVLRLRGNTSWGVWYGRVKVPEETARSLDFEDPVHKVTVYDRDDEVIAEMDFKS
ncbi:hypothetical protein [Streptomyces sp. MA5143a]|uniref:hypothetical protein n=1 Tax=Streptomyces sp. MA5143a TaxID=2083010 RepID=UPI000D1A7870|nr:hypothetical protein [Streptomyces sp. MA5143a]SPF01614.1 hypothetical protein SMA5143A_2348 [Streptomyces sp. MA5143a]